MHAPGASKEAGCHVLRANRKGTVKENSSACLLEAGELVLKRSMAAFCPMGRLLVEMGAVFFLWEGVGQDKP